MLSVFFGMGLEDLDWFGIVLFLFSFFRFFLMYPFSKYRITIGLLSALYWLWVGVGLSYCLRVSFVSVV